MINFLTTLDLQEYSPIFQEEGIDDLETLKDYSEEELKELGLKGGHVKKILKALNAFSDTAKVTTTQSFVYPENLNPKNMVTYLAHPWEEYLKEEHPSVKLHWLVDTAEVVVRWVCALLLAEIRAANDNHLPEAIQKKFKENISRPTLGVWLNFVEKLSQVKLEKTYLEELFDIYPNELNIDGVFPDEGDDKTSLLTLRNRIAHGGPTTPTQSKAYLDIYAPRLESLLLSVNNIMSNAKLYGHFDGTCYLLQGLESTPEKCSVSIDGPYIKINGTTLSLWPLVEFDKVRQLDDNGILEEKTSLTPQTYLRTDKQGVQYIPMGVEESYSISNKNKQEAFETIFALNIKTKKSPKTKRQEYQHDDFLKEAKYLKNELIGRVNEIETVKTWIKSIDSFDHTIHCRYIYGGPGLGKSMIMASIASDLSNDNDKNNHIFYYRFRGGDARNNKETFVRLLRDSLISWPTLSAICEEGESLISTDDIVKDLEIRIAKVKELAPYPKKINETVEIEVKPILRLLIDGLDEVLAQDSSMLRVINDLQKQGIVTLIATRLENGAEALTESSWSEALVFKEETDGLPPMSEDDIRGMLLEGISKAQRKELIENDSEKNASNPLVQNIAKKAEGLPLYIHLLINDLQNNKYALSNINKLPDGLNQYYYELVNRMGINDVDSYKAPVITLLSVTTEPIDSEAIALVIDDIEDVEETEPLIDKVVLAVGSLLKQVTTKEDTIGYTLYHQSFRDFINKAENDAEHPLYKNLKKIKKALYKRAEQWRELPTSNLKNHLFRSATAYTLDWETDGLEVVKNRLTNLEYLLQRTEQLPAIELENLLKEYELVQSKLPEEEQKEFYIWSSFFREKLHIIARVDETTWKPSQSLFQLAYEDGEDSSLTKQADKIIKEKKIKFLWIKKRNRSKKYRRTGLKKVLAGHTSLITGAKVLQDGRILSYSGDTSLRLWSDQGELLALLEGHTCAVMGIEVLNDGRILSYSWDQVLRLWSDQGEFISSLEGHTSSVNGVKLMLDGRILSYSSDTTLRLWSNQGEFISSLEGHTAYINGVEILEDGRILSYSSDNTLRLWSDQGEFISSLEGHTASVNGVKLMIDGRILSYSDDNTLRLWSDQGEFISSLEGHTSSVNGVKLMIDGCILSYSSDTTIRLWSNQGEFISSLEGHTAYINGVEILEDGRILSYSSDNTLRLWSDQGEFISSLEGHTASVNGVKLMLDGRILSYSGDTTIRLWSDQGELLALLEGHTNEIVGVEILKDGCILSYSGDTFLRLWSDQEKFATLSKEEIHLIRYVQVLQDGRILSYSDDNTIRLWSDQGEFISSLEGHTASVKGVMLMQDGRILSYSSDTTIRLWSDQGEFISSLEGHTASVKGVMLMQDGRILSYSSDNTLRLWSDQGEFISSLEGHTASVKGVMLMQDGRILSYSSDNTLRLWSDQGEFISSLEGHTASVKGVMLMQDGRILSYSNDTTIRLWSDQGKFISSLGGNPHLITGVKLMQDGRILSYSIDNTLRLWSDQGEFISSLEGHTAYINGVEILEDGRILSYSNDNTLRLWSDQGELLALLKGHTSFITSVEILEDGHILSYSYDNILRLWNDQGRFMTQINFTVDKINLDTIEKDFLVVSNGEYLLMYDFYNGNKKASLSDIVEQCENLLL